MFLSLKSGADTYHASGCPFSFIKLCAACNAKAAMLTVNFKEQTIALPGCYTLNCKFTFQKLNTTI
jgi:hypothetical protein